MSTRSSISLLLLSSFLFVTVELHADWSSDWKQTVAAAKKEERLNLYIGPARRIQKGLPRDQDRLGQRHRGSTRHQDSGGNSRRENHRGHIQRRAQLEL
jgi:hypothetical protein